MVDKLKSSKKHSRCDIVASREKAITFAVDDVKPAMQPLWTDGLDQCLELLAGVSVIEMPVAALRY